MKNQKGVAPIIIIFLLLLAVAGGAYYLGTKNTKPIIESPTVSSPSPTTTAQVDSTIDPTSSEIMGTQPNTSPVSNGVSLEQIKYTLPSTWTAKTYDENLILSAAGGGYLSIKTYKYPGTTGRREFYCSLGSACIEGTSYFNPMRIGNIDGYSANALDNSGGGIEYFGAKGNTFYVISTYGPPPPNEFEKTYQSVLDSLVF